jgi:hypothetical protein
MQLVALALALGLAPGVFASNVDIAGYSPATDVTDHNAMDLDVKSMSKILDATVTQTLINNAYAVYESGGNSRAEAKFVLSGSYTDGQFEKGLKVKQGTTAEGKVYKDSKAAELRVIYSTTCKDGGLPTAEKDVTGCFDDTTALVITKDDDTTVTIPAADIALKGGKKAYYRTLKGFSTGGDAKMTLEPYFMYYAAYYAQATGGSGIDLSAHDVDGTAGSQYAHQMVLHAKAKTGPFANADEKAQKEGIMKGSVYMNAFMYTIHEMEDAIDDCKSGCTDCNEALNAGPAHAWDEAVAFYTGTDKGIYLTAAEDPDKKYGVMGFALAEKRCVNFGTCQDGTDKASGSMVNKEIFELFDIGLNLLNNGECNLVIPVKDAIVQKMAIPLIQGTLRYANKVSSTKTRGSNDKSLAEGFVFAASVVPMINTCRRTDAKTIELAVDLKKGKATLPTDTWNGVKEAFENNYECLNITCSDVGTLYDATGDNPVTNGEACTFKIGREQAEDAPMFSTVAIAAIAAAGAAVVVFALLACYCQQQKNNTIKMYNDLKAPGGAPAEKELA